MLNTKSLIFVLIFTGFITFLPTLTYGADFPQVTKLSPSGTARFVASAPTNKNYNQVLLLASIRDQLEAIRIRFQEILKTINR